MKKIILILFFLFNLNKVYSEAGEHALAFIKIPVFARATALGNAFTAMTADATCILYNPAAIVINGTSLQLGYNKYLVDINQGAICCIKGNNNIGIGVGLNALHTGKIDKRNKDGTLAGEFSAEDMNLLLTAAKRINYVNIGGGLKYFRERLDDETAGAYALDCGILLKQDRFNIGLAGQNVLATKIKFINEAENLPKIIRLGVLIKPVDNFLLTTDIEKIIGYKKINISIGTEVTIAKFLLLRAGYISKFSEKDLGRSKIVSTGLAVGCGINIKFINFDFAYLPYGDLGVTYKASLGLRY